MSSKKFDRLMDRLPAYLNDEMAEEEAEAFETEFCKVAGEENLAQLKESWLLFAALPQAEPSQALSSQFHTMLESYKAGQSQAHSRSQHAVVEWLKNALPRMPVGQFSFGAILVLIGFVLGRWGIPDSRTDSITALRSEVNGLQQLVTASLLQSRSPSDRLRGVSYGYKSTGPTEETLRMLLDILDHDPNLNVRLAAADALSLVYDQEKSSWRLIESLQRQTSPMLQIALIGILEKKQDQRSLAALRDLVSNQDVEALVKERAGAAIERLE